MSRKRTKRADARRGENAHKDAFRIGYCRDVSRLFSKGVQKFFFIICRLSTHFLGMHCQLSTQYLAKNSLFKMFLFYLKIKITYKSSRKILSFFIVLNFLLKYALPVKYAIFSRKILCLKCFFLLWNKKKHLSSDGKILYFLIYYTVLNLAKLKLKEPEKIYL